MVRLGSQGRASWVLPPWLRELVVHFLGDVAPLDLSYTSHRQRLFSTKKLFMVTYWISSFSFFVRKVSLLHKLNFLIFFIMSKKKYNQARFTLYNLTSFLYNIMSNGKDTSCRAVERFGTVVCFHDIYSLFWYFCQYMASSSMGPRCKVFCLGVVASALNLRAATNSTTALDNSLVQAWTQPGGSTVNQETTGMHVVRVVYRLRFCNVSNSKKSEPDCNLHKTKQTEHNQHGLPDNNHKIMQH